MKLQVNGPLIRYFSSSVLQYLNPQNYPPHNKLQTYSTMFQPKQPLKNNSSSNQNNPLHLNPIITNQQTKQPLQSQEYKQHYEPIMKQVPVPSLEQAKQNLKSVGIIYTENQVYVGFTKFCLRTDWESTIYRVRFGNFEADLKVIKSRLDPKVISHKVLNKGNFGTISIFQLGTNVSYALKNIAIKGSSLQSINKILSQIFIAKILSALEVGPKFSQILSYDAIIYESSVHFAMEVCQISDLQNLMKKQAQEKTLFSSLKLMHSFQICHADIKYDNIGWSQAFGKFVFLDFGLSLVIGEPPGYKTETEFRGTYSYCSPEMKKLFFFKQAYSVDLYRNDLFCLELALKAMEKNQAITFVESPSNSDFSQTVQVQVKEPLSVKNMSLVRYFQVKFNYFQRNYQKVQLLISNEKILLQTFGKMFWSYKQNKFFQKYFSKLEEKMKKRKNLQNDPLNSLSDIDLVLYQSEMSSSNKFEMKQNFIQKIIQIAESDNLFAQIWADDVWKQQLFFFIDVYSNKEALSYEQYRKKLIQKVFKKQFPLESNQTSMTMKFREVLIFYSEIFEKNRNIDMLQHILTYFILMGDQYTRQKIEGKILDFYEASEKYSVYLRENLRYFIGKLVLIHKIGFSCARNNIEYAEKMSCKLKQIKASEYIIKRFEETTKIMKSIFNACRSKGSLQKYHKTTEQIKKYLKLVVNDLDSQIKMFINSVIIADPDTSILTTFLSPIKIQLQNSYLRAYIFVSRIFSTANSVQRIQKHTKLLNSDQFTRQYSTILHFLTLGVIQKKERSKEFLNMNIKLDVSTIYFDFWESMVFSKSLDDTLDFCVEYLKGYEARTSKLSFPQDLLFMLYNIMTCFFTFTLNLPHRKFKKLEQVVSPILKQTQIYALGSQISIEKRTNQINFIFSQKDHNFYLWHISKIYLLMFQAQQLEAFQLISSIIDKNPVIVAILSIISHIKPQNLPSQKSKAFQKMIFHISDILFEKRYYELIVTIDGLLFLILTTHIKSGYSRLAFLRIKELSQFHRTSSFFKFFWNVKTFIEFIFPSPDIRAVVDVESKEKLRKITQYSKFTYFLGLFYFKLKRQIDGIPPQLTKRLIIICVVFVEEFKEGSFRSYKNKLWKQAILCVNSGRKTISIRKLTCYHYRRHSLKQSLKQIDIISQKKRNLIPSQKIKHRLVKVMNNRQLKVKNE